MSEVVAVRAWKVAVLLSLLMLLGPGTTVARSARAVFPLDCRLGEDCWIVRLVDRDPGPGVRDLSGAVRSEDGHRGIDIAIPDLFAMIRGVVVRAPLPGTVVGVRDGEPDVPVNVRGREAVRGRECGNGVRIRHEGGLVSQLCHLRRGSVAVRPGDAVRAGTPVGLVGLSGLTSFPHLHLQLQREGRVVDPLEEFPELFAGFDPASLARLPVVVAAGVAPTTPAFPDVQRGDFAAPRIPPLPATAPALVLWVRGYWFEAGDQVDFTLLGPDGGRVFATGSRIQRGRRHMMRYAGRRRPPGGWTPGRYRAKIAVRRGGAETVREFAFEIVE